MLATLAPGPECGPAIVVVQHERWSAVVGEEARNDEAYQAARGAGQGPVPLTLERPRLPGWLASVEVENLRLGQSRLTFRALRGHNGTAVELLAREGNTELVVRP